MEKSKKGTKVRQEIISDEDFAGDDKKKDFSQKGKTGKQKTGKKFSDEEDDVIESKASKANQKRGKKDTKSDNIDLNKSDEERSTRQANASAKAKGKKTNKDEAKSDQKTDKKITAKKEYSEDEDDDGDGPIVAAPKKARPQNLSAFQMLAIEGDSGSSNDDDDDDRESDSSVQEKKVEMANKKSKSKKQTKPEKKKPVTREDEDIDKIVAEISSAGTKSRKKKEDRTKESAEERENPMASESTDAKPQPAVNISSNVTQEELYKMMDELDLEEDDDDADQKGRKKKGRQAAAAAKKQNSKEEMSDEDVGDTATVKTAAQKKKEKKERQKADKQKMKGVEKKDERHETEKLSDAKQSVAGKDENKSSESAPVGALPTEAAEAGAAAADRDTAAAQSNDAHLEATSAAASKEPEDTAEDGKSSKKDKKKKKDDKEKEKPKKPSKMVQEILEQQKRIKEEEERLKREEEERIRKEEETIRLKEEEERRIREKKEKLKQKKKEKIERLKKDGKFLTEKQKEAVKRLMQMPGIVHKDASEEVQVSTAEKRPPRYERKKKKATNDKTGSAQTTPVDGSNVEPALAETMQTTVAETEVDESKTLEAKEEEEEEKDDVKDTWEDMNSAEEEEGDEEEEEGDALMETKAKETVGTEEGKRGEKEKSVEPGLEEEDESSEEEDSEASESSSEEDDGKTPQERAREKALARIQKRKAAADVQRSLDKLRAPVVCVLGHVDTGKTKILDKLRRTNVQDGEAGGITQQIGATNVPQETIKEQTKMCKEFQKQELKLPGLLIIDTPGHESFSNLRTRGSSLCDIAILVVDIMHGLEAQTIESINLLKDKNTPFIVALNKIDRLYGWQTNPHSDIVNTLNRQKPNTRMEFNDRVQQVIVQFAEQGLNAILFNENKDPTEYYSLVPTSAHTGDGMGNLIALICEMTQKMFADRVMFSEELKATVMEVKTIHGLGTTIDVILVNGRIREGDHIVVAGQEGPIVTQIRALLMPQPLRELRVKSQYEHHKEVVAAQGCKIIAKDLEKALAGLPLHVAVETDEIEVYKEELSEMLKSVLGDVKVVDKGVFVQASTLGSLEALLQFLKTSEIPYAGINIGPVHKKDITRASVMLEHDPQYAVILAFDVKVEHEAQVMADSLGVRIFTADIIYHLFDAFTKYRDDFKRQKREEFKNIAVFPCKLKILPQFIFNSRDPIVVGVVIEAGFLKEGTLLCVPSKEFLEVGRVSSIEVNHKTMEKATKGQEVCIKIDPIPGEAPKMFGRHFDENDLLVSKISRQSIDAVKNYFREEMTKTDWQLIMELKKTFEIL